LSARSGNRFTDFLLDFPASSPRRAKPILARTRTVAKLAIHLSTMNDTIEGQSLTTRNFELAREAAPADPGCPKRAGTCNAAA